MEGRLNSRALAVEVVSLNPDQQTFFFHVFSRIKFAYAHIYLSLLDLNSGDHTAPRAQVFHALKICVSTHLSMIAI